MNKPTSNLVGNLTNRETKSATFNKETSNSTSLALTMCKTGGFSSSTYSVPKSDFQGKHPGKANSQEDDGITMIDPEKMMQENEDI